LKTIHPGLTSLAGIPNPILNYQNRLKGLSPEKLYQVFCIEGQTWLVAALLKMYWKLQENKSYHFALSIHGHNGRADTKDLIRKMPIDLPLEHTFEVKIPVRKTPLDAKALRDGGYL
jgi:hypothetical protein